MAIVQITVRAFCTSDEDITFAPAIVATLDATKLGGSNVDLPKLYAAAKKAIEGIPFKGVREMTDDEAKAFIQDEKDEEARDGTVVTHNLK